MSDEEVKSAYDLAMEKAQQMEASNGVEPKEVSSLSEELEAMEQAPVTDLITEAAKNPTPKLKVIAPLNKRVTVRIEGPLEKTAGGIIIPDMAKDKEAPTRGTVMAVALDCREDTKRMLQPGMQVVFSKYAGVDIHTTVLGNKEEIKFQIIKEDDILAILVDRDVVGEYAYVPEGAM